MQYFSGQKIFAGAVVVAVAMVVVYGVWIAGSPKLERQRQFDERRVQDLMSIQNFVQAYYANQKHLPKDQEDIMFSSLGPSPNSLFDPETGVPYEYSMQDPAEGTYRLCAQFAATTSDDPDWRTMSRSWTHPAGHYCFFLSATTGAVVGLDPVGVPPKPCIGNCAEPAVSTLDVVQEGDLLDIPRVCSLMRSKSDGSMHCVACTGTQKEKTCRDAAEDWEFYDVSATPGRVGIPYGCTMTESGCDLVQ
ncbi:hypothetical protein KBD18_02730 [Patescibacteria group bacterium]|nr:hypothetical protein [Patescibacteria group bacterium]